MSTISSTPNLALSLISSSVGSVEVVNQNTAKLDGFLGGGAVNIGINTPPSSFPADGDVYIIGTAPAAGSAWENAAKNVAIGHNGQWLLIPPQEGMTFYNRSDSLLYRYDGSTWSAVSTPSAGVAGRLALRGNDVGAGLVSFTSGDAITWNTEINEFGSVFTYSLPDATISIPDDKIVQVNAMVVFELSGVTAGAQFEIGIRARIANDSSDVKYFCEAYQTLSPNSTDDIEHAVTLSAALNNDKGSAQTLELEVLYSLVSGTGPTTRRFNPVLSCLNLEELQT